MPKGHPRVVNSYLTGRGGVGLVMFRLARLNIDFVVLPDNCPFGDLWIDRNGEKKILEVKTSRNGYSWHVNLKQLHDTHYYCLVDMKSARCYVLTAQEVRDCIIGRTIIGENLCIIPSSIVPKHSDDNWRLITGEREEDPPAPARPRGSRGNPLKPKFVKKRLADGSVRIYQYDRMNYVPPPLPTFS